MYRMLIVEDEDIEREGLIDLVDWGNMSINVIGAVESAEEALEFVQNNEIDILFTDIKLFGKSGLELAKELTELFPKLKVIITSGYHDFEYAKTAIELDAYGFLTKPLDMVELESVVAKVMNTFKKENEEINEREKYKKLLEQSMPLLKNKFFYDLINGDVEESVISENLSYFDIKLDLRQYVVIVTEIDKYEMIRQSKSNEELYMMVFELLEIINNCKFEDILISFHLSQQRFFTIFNTSVSSRMELHQRLISFTRLIQNKVNDAMGISVTIGIGKAVDKLSEINHSYKKACEAVDYKFYMGNNQIIDYNDINTGYVIGSTPQIDIEDLESKIISSVELCDFDSLNENIIKLFKRIKSSPTIPNAYLKNLFINLLAKTQVKLFDMNESFESIFGKESYIWDKIMKFDTIVDAQQWIMNNFKLIIEYLSRKRDNSNKKIIKDILHIIENNYNKNISIADISKEIYLSPNYISIIFKKEIGESFTDYVVRYKIEKAKRMLKETNLKVYQIGSMVGYSNISHFCSVFKTFYGVSPSEYREKA